MEGTDAPDLQGGIAVGDLADGALVKGRVGPDAGHSWCGVERNILRWAPWVRTITLLSAMVSWWTIRFGAPCTMPVSV